MCVILSNLIKKNEVMKLDWMLKSICADILISVWADAEQPHDKVVCK